MKKLIVARSILSRPGLRQLSMEKKSSDVANHSPDFWGTSDDSKAEPLSHVTSVRWSHTSIYCPQLNMSTPAIESVYNTTRKNKFDANRTSLATLIIDHEQQTLVDNMKRSVYVYNNTRQDVAKICQFEEERSETTTGRPHDTIIVHVFVCHPTMCKNLEIKPYSTTFRTHNLQDE